MFRTPHIHFAISKNAHRLLTTQLFVKGDEANARDHILSDIKDAQARESVLIDFKRLPDSKIGELAANFDIVLGTTPPDGDGIHGGLAKPARR
jgi:protocatechuate 3,4-dioxygenase beta subunit